MDEFKNPYNRLERYFIAIEGLIQNQKRDERRVPIMNIAEHAGIPMEIFRADLYCILEAAFEEYTLVLNGEYVSDLYEKDDAIDKAAFRKDLLSGKLDNAKLEISIHDDNVMLPLTGEESSVMDYLLHEHGRKKPNRALPFVIKDSYHFTFMEEKINETLYDIRSAIIRQKEIKIREADGHSKKELCIRPVRLVYDSTENLYAVIYLDGDGLGIYRIDKIKYLGDGKSFELPADLNKRLKIIPNIWGMDIKAKPMKVRVRIFAFHGRGNVGRKVRKDLEHRINGNLYEDGECLIYEDKIYGKDAFLRWIFGYGNSVVIEKPESLRKEVIGILKKETGKQSGDIKGP